MAKKSAVRTLVVLTCTECKKYSYNTEKNRRNTPDRTNHLQRHIQSRGTLGCHSSLMCTYERGQVPSSIRKIARIRSRTLPCGVVRPKRMVRMHNWFVPLKIVRGALLTF